MKRLLVAVALAAAFLVSAAPAAATVKHPAPLHLGSRGKRVKNLQWLLSGHKPSHYYRLHTFHSKIDGQYGPKTAKAVKRMKWLLGYPTKLDIGRRSGRYLTALLLGKARRSIPMIARAAKRQATLKRQKTTVTACVRRVLAYAREEIGVEEIPLGSNWGPAVAMFQSVTGAFHQPWCVSFVQWALWRAHKGPIANRTAGAIYLRDWAYQHGLLHSRPEPGAIAVWIYSDQHADLVESVHGTSYTTIDGNWADRVMRVNRSLIYEPPAAFIYLPRCAG